MAKTGKEQDKEAAIDPAANAARVPDFSEAMKLNPLMANMAAATAIGFGIATQMAGVFFGALQGAMETGNRQKADEAAPAAGGTAEAPAPVVAEPAVVAAVPQPAPGAEKPKAARKAAVPSRKIESAGKPVARKPATNAAAPKVATPGSVSEVGDKQPAAAKSVKAKAVKAPVGGGDLKRISGIGPKLEGVLNEMGVTTIAQVAAWTDKDIAGFDKKLGFEGRIGRDDWVGQAKALLK